MTENTAAQPTAHEAAAALAAAETSAATVRKSAYGVVVAMAGFAAASVAGLLVLGLVGGAPGTVAGTTFIVGAAVALSVVGATAKARPAGFMRNYLIAIGAWALIYVAALVIGLTLLPGVAAFWIPAALISAIPGLWFGIAGWR